MSRRRTIRAWKDPAFRKRLGAAELAAMPANPAGTIDLDDADLGVVAGGFETTATVCECTPLTLCPSSSTMCVCCPTVLTVMCGGCIDPTVEPGGPWC
jgi:mersacidin/lichenicidin family type 2 lantibiotic